MNIDRIRAAAERLNGHVRRTPLLSSPFIDAIAGRRVLVKAECLQHTGSFKFRGGWSALSAMPDAQRQKGVIAYSSGNHAQGVANAARHFGVPSVILMPSNAPQIKIANTRALGAEVVLYDRATENRDAIGDALAADRGLTLVKPFDDPDVIAGQGTCGLEIAEQARELGIDRAEVLVCCGGGGFASGIALALAAEAPQMQVRTVEPDGFDDVKRSLASGRIELNAQTSGSICDAILTPAPSELTFGILKQHCGAGIAVSDSEALAAMKAAFDRLRVVIEPGGAAALAAAMFHRSEIAADTVIVTASGGNVDPSVFIRALQE